LGRKFNLHLVSGPDELAKLDFVNSLEKNVSVESFFKFRQSNWYIFEKKK
jgi:hypothetical protein